MQEILLIRRAKSFLEDEQSCQTADHVSYSLAHHDETSVPRVAVRVPVQKERGHDLHFGQHHCNSALAAG